ncbi:S1 RNA-binding domain-containing protein [Streptomyces sp. NPDC013181]|uniref:S1 RNA-binding domain-containing protein n=1 Tax=Streptomyces sp. NPDC013181 TaxID=3364864 RepID=UPI0036BBFEB4
MDNLAQKFHDGDVCRGIVSDVANFGVFVDLGGCTGFANITEVSWVKFTQVSEVMRVGQEVVSVVIGVDSDREQVLLSFKALWEDPLKVFARERFGKVFTGSVAKFTSIGAFVSLTGGIQGLLPRPALLADGVNLQVGDKVSVVVAGVNIDRRQVLLSLAGNLV